MLNYNAPIEGQKSSIDGSGSDQTRVMFWLRKSLSEARKDAYFSQLSRTENMPKHYGKTITVYEYIPLLDDRNVNDQGIDANGATMVDGNLYGSSKDIGKINSRLPMLTEEGGRVNRVGFTRVQLKGSLHKMGFFFDFTKESLDFDSDDALLQKLSTEAINGAYQLTEAILQKDLLTAATTVVYAGAADADDEVTGEEDTVNDIPASVVTIDDLTRLEQILNDKRVPKDTKIIDGSRMTDTRVIPSSRLMYVGSEVTPLLRKMRDHFDAPAFIGVQHYANAGDILRGEVGQIDSFRIIEVPEMLHWAGKGAEVTDNPGYRTAVNEANEERYNIYPMLVVGSESFVNIGFETGGKAFKFTIMTKMPGKETMGHDDPFGETGLTSIKWYYGTLILRSERLGLIKTVAPL